MVRSRQNMSVIGRFFSLSLPKGSVIFATLTVCSLTILGCGLSSTRQGQINEESKRSVQTQSRGQKTPPNTTSMTEEERKSLASNRKLIRDILSHDYCDSPEQLWLNDEAEREYCIKKVPKIEGTYVWDKPEKRIRVYPFYTLKVLRYDEDYFYFKFYKAVKSKPSVTRRKLTPTELQQLAETYQVNIKESDSLQFRAFDSGLPQRGQWRNGFAIADMNGDGNLDLIHGPARKGRTYPLIFLGDGKGQWNLWKEVQFPQLPYTYGDVAIGDINNDGKLDLVFAMHLTGIVALTGDGEGRFTLWSKGLEFKENFRDEYIPFSSRAIELSDWDGDGHLDVLVFGEGPRPTFAMKKGPSRKKGKEEKRGRLSEDLGTSAARGLAIFMNNQDGSWTRKQSPSRGKRSLFGDSFSVGDVNGDGRVDVVSSSSVLSRKDVLHLGTENNEWISEELDLVRSRSIVTAVEVTDLNGDGRNDLVLAYLSFELEKWMRGVDFVFAKPDGTWTRQAVLADESRKSVRAVASGDLDGDGRKDVVAATGDGELVIFLADGHGFVKREKSPELIDAGAGCRGYSLALRDLDRDGRDEIIAGFAGELSSQRLTTPKDAEAKKSCTSGGSLTVWKSGLK